MSLGLALTHGFCNTLGDFFFFSNTDLIEVHALGRESLEDLVDQVFINVV